MSPIRKMRLLSAAIAVLCGFSAQADFLYSSEITVSGYQGTTELKGFPVLVRVSAAKVPGFDYTKCRADALDIQFSSTDGSVVYPHEIEKWDTFGESLVWVRLPSLAGKTTKFRFAFGDASYATPANTNAVWATSNDGFYAGVWHFGETYTGNESSPASAPSRDSARHSSDLVMDAMAKKNVVSMNTVSGPVGNARIVNNTTVDCLVAPNYDQFHLGGTFSFSCWIHTDNQTSAVNYPRLFGRSNEGWKSENAWCAFPWANIKGIRVYLGPSGSATISPAMSMRDEWVHYMLSVTETGYATYVNGVKNSSGTLSAPVEDNGRGLGFGGKPNHTGGDLPWQFDEARLLSSAASADWAQAEYATQVSNDFITAAQARVTGKDLLLVSGYPEAYGTVTPTWGTVSNTLGVASVHCVASPDETVVSDTLRVQITGWKLYEYDADGNRIATPIAESEKGELTCDYTPVTGKTRELVWQVDYKYPVTVTASRDVTLTVDGAAAELGVNWLFVGTHTLSVVSKSGVAGSDWTFRRWTGDVASVADPTVPSISLTVSGVQAVHAGYVSTFRVAKTGDDETGDGSLAKPYQSLAKVLTWAGDYDTVCVQGGVYEENVTVSGKREFSLCGGYDGSWVRDLKGHPTVFKAADAAKPVLVLAGCVSNKVSGVVLTGGSYGLKIGHTTGHDISQVIVTNNAASGIFYWANGSAELSGMPFAIRSSLISGNGGYGIEESNTDWNLKQSCHLLNCTLVGNASGPIRNQLVPVYARNTIFVGGDKPAVDRSMQFAYDGPMHLKNCCVDGSVTIASDAAPTDFVWEGGNLRLPARLAADGSLADDSRCLKRGTDLSANEPFAVTEDVYGTAWNGAYDIGAVKSASSVVKGTALAEVYVSPDGDDDNDGASAATPVRTIGEGLMMTASKGVCHLAKGTYDETVWLETEGVTLAGAGRDETRVGAACPGPVESASEPAIVFAAHNATVSGLSVTNGFIGIFLDVPNVSTNQTVRDCRFAHNRHGVYAAARGAITTDSTRRIVRCEMSDNAKCGLYIAAWASCTLEIDACLVANSGEYGLYVSHAISWICNSTFVGNGKNAVYNYLAWGNQRSLFSYNSIYDDSPVAWQFYNFTTPTAVFPTNLFNCTENFIGFTKSNLDAVTNTCLFVDPQLEKTGRKCGKPAAESPVWRAGADLGDGSDLATDLVGKAYSKRHRDIGCYARQCGLMLIIR